MPADKYLYNNAGYITERAAVQSSAGAANTGNIPALNAAGVLDASFLPPGIAADTSVVTASEALSAGAFVNIWNNAGAFAVRNADATVAGKEAHGFVLAAVASGAAATVYFNGTNNALAGQTPGRKYLSTTAGAAQAAAPAGSGNAVQVLGFAPAANIINFTAEPPVILA